MFPFTESTLPCRQGEILVLFCHCVRSTSTQQSGPRSEYLFLKLFYILHLQNKKDQKKKKGGGGNAQDYRDPVQFSISVVFLSVLVLQYVGWSESCSVKPVIILNLIRA